MISKILPRYVIAGVIQNSYYANYMSVELSKQIIGDSARNYYLEDPKKYFVIVFLLRNVTFLGIYLLNLNQLSLLVNIKSKNMNKQLINFQLTMK